MTYMPFLQQHPDSLWRNEGPLPNPKLGPDLTQQIQNSVSLLTVLKLDAMVLSSHSHTRKPG